jgi:Domain of unknown function (DUF1824)
MPLPLDAACHLLRQFNCLDTAQPEPDLAALRQALLQVAQASDYQILGICAGSLAEGVQALESYATALDYQPMLSATPIEGAVYIKFNPTTGLCYANPYSGSYRGVLVSCQSAYESGVNEMFGHLPLDLFVQPSQLL